MASKFDIWIELAVAIMIAVVVIPIAIDEIQNTNTTGWTFTGASGATTLWLLIPFGLVAGLLIDVVRKVMTKGK